MDKNFKLIENRKLLVGYIKLILIAMLVIIEIIICAQYTTRYMENGKKAVLIAVIISCAVLAVLDAIDSYVIKNVAIKYVFFGLDSVCGCFCVSLRATHIFRRFTA